MSMPTLTKKIALPVVAACTALLAACAQPAQEPVSSVASVPSSSVSTVVAEPAPASEKPAVKDRDIDFAPLKEQNSDVVAWLEVEGTNIDYPVVYCMDNTYYLQHDLDGNYYVGGSIFLDMANTREIDMPVVAMYGHYMPDDTLFTQLHNFEDQDFFEEYGTVKVFTPENQFTYEVVAAVRVDDRYVFYNYETNEYTLYDNKQDVEYFINWISSTRDLAANINMEDCTPKDQFLVLSTCTQLATSNDRYVVVARLVDMI